MEPLFDHERLEVYQIGRQFNREVRELLAAVPRGNAESTSLDELVDFALIDERRIAPAKATLARVVSMLIAMIRSLEARTGKDMGA